GALPEGAIEIAKTRGFGCARRKGGEVVCWGKNGDGQLGDGTTIARATPALVRDAAAKTIAVGGGHACASLMNGALACWGRNTRGELGDGAVSFKREPVVAAAAKGADALALGRDHTCARTGESVHCWGANTHGQLGVVEPEQSTAAVRARVGDARIVEVAAS